MQIMVCTSENITHVLKLILRFFHSIMQLAMEDLINRLSLKLSLNPLQYP